jgi:hypothetical protein
MTIRITEFDDHGILAVDLKDILSLCGLNYKERVWIAYDVECTPGEWWERFNKDPYLKLELRYDEVFDYANSVAKTFDGIFYALKENMKSNKKRFEYKNVKKVSDFIIEYVDAGFVEVTTDNKTCTNSLKKKYKNCQIIK